MVNKRKLGKEAESLAVKFLIENGYIIINKNFRCKIGEIDIIANDKDYTVFIEVKYRKTNKNGLPCEAVTFNKQKTIIKVAQYYLSEKNIYYTNCRFDVLEMFGELNNIKINLIKNAFQC